MEKTNAMRLLEQAKLSYQAASYDFDENDLNGLNAALGIGMPPEQVFKTLVARGASGAIYVFCIPVCAALNLKKAAKATKEKSVALVPVKELLGLTGYIRGGCSPIGMKKKYPTYLDETAVLYEEIAVSAGARGRQLLLNGEILAAFLSAVLVDLTE